MAKQYDVSRQFVYRQKDRAISAVDDAFDETSDDNEKILFHLPVTKAWLGQLTICLMLHGRTSFRNIKSLIKHCFDYDISVGSIHDIFNSTQLSATKINDNQDLFSVKLAAHEEIFHHNKPVLAGVDIPSLYCYLLSSEDQRDGDTWTIHFMDLQQKKFKPERVIGDDGSGLRCAHEMILDDIPFDYDVFHLLKLLMDTRRYFRNHYNSSVSYLIKMEDKMGSVRLQGNSSSLSRAISSTIMGSKKK